jgi:exoribonuclease R
MVAIADPTQHIDPRGSAFRAILDNVLTHYPSGQEPDHMLSDELLHLSNLNGHCRAIVVDFHLSATTYEVLHTPELYFAKLNIAPGHKYSYCDPILSTVPQVQIGLLIADALAARRRGINLTELNLAAITVQNDVTVLCQETPATKRLQAMIAEFAILTNGFVGQFLQHHYGEAIFRSMEGNTPELRLIGDARQTFQHIVAEGMKARYSFECSEHVMLNLNHYTHFTSPMRRASDVIAHFMVKAIVLGLPPPFTFRDLSVWSENISKVSRHERSTSFRDKKLRVCSYIARLASVEAVRLEYRFTGQYKHFVNFTITKVNDKNVYVSYSVLEQYVGNINYYHNNPDDVVWVTVVDPFAKQDFQVIPEMAAHIAHAGTDLQRF